MSKTILTLFYMHFRIVKEISKCVDIIETKVPIVEEGIWKSRVWDGKKESCGDKIKLEVSVQTQNF